MNEITATKMNEEAGNADSADLNPSAATGRMCIGGSTMDAKGRMGINGSMNAPARHRKGIMGGTFDPIHNGHLKLAACALDQFRLDEVLFLPSGNPPHKQRRSDGATNEQRLEMVRLAIAGYPRFALDEVEMHRCGLTYTKDTLTLLNEREPDTDFYFIIGADSLMAFDGWYHPEIICKYCHLIVAVRDGVNRSEIRQKMEELCDRYGASVFLLKSPEIAVSSTHLRQMIRERQPIGHLVPQAVTDYIETHDIYGGTRI